jgi:hypothetical protein
MQLSAGRKTRSLSGKLIRFVQCYCVVSRKKRLRNRGWVPSHDSEQGSRFDALGGWGQVGYEPYSESRPGAQRSRWFHQERQLIHWRPGQHFDQVHHLDAQDIEVGMPFPHVRHCFV